MSLFFRVGVDRCNANKLDIILLHTLQLANTFVENECSLPFLVQPVGSQHLAIASERGLAVLGWQCHETEEAFVCSLAEVSRRLYSIPVSLQSNLDIACTATCFVRGVDMT